MCSYISCLSYPVVDVGRLCSPWRKQTGEGRWFTGWHCSTERAQHPDQCAPLCRTCILPFPALYWWGSDEVVLNRPCLTCVFFSALSPSKSIKCCFSNRAWMAVCCTLSSVYTVCELHGRRESLRMKSLIQTYGYLLIPNLGVTRWFKVFCVIRHCANQIQGLTTSNNALFLPSPGVSS